MRPEHRQVLAAAAEAVEAQAVTLAQRLQESQEEAVSAKHECAELARATELETRQREARNQAHVENHARQLEALRDEQAAAAERIRDHAAEELAGLRREHATELESAMGRAAQSHGQAVRPSARQQLTQNIAATRPAQTDGSSPHTLVCLWQTRPGDIIVVPYVPAC